MVSSESLIDGINLQEASHSNRNINSNINRLDSIQNINSSKHSK